MTAAELMRILQSVPDDLPVYVRDDSQEYEVNRVETGHKVYVKISADWQPITAVLITWGID